MINKIQKLHVHLILSLIIIVLCTLMSLLLFDKQHADDYFFIFIATIIFTAIYTAKNIFKAKDNDPIIKQTECN